jgi:hypothetical protein
MLRNVRNISPLLPRGVLGAKKKRKRGEFGPTDDGETDDEIVYGKMY